MSGNRRHSPLRNKKPALTYMSPEEFKQRQIQLANKPIFNHHKFMRKETEEWYKVMEHKSVVKERSFNLGIGECPTIIGELEQRGWATFNSSLKDGNRTIALEFFANALQQKNRAIAEESWVRGKVVRYSSRSINECLGIATPEMCAVEARRQGLQNMDEEGRHEILHELCREGATWCSAGEGKLPTRFPQRVMKPLARAWAKFVTHNIEVTSNNTEVTLEKAVFVQALIRGENIDLGRLLYEDLYKMANERSAKRCLGHMGLITTLCAKKGVEVEEGDEMYPAMRGMTRAWIESLPEEAIDNEEI